MRFEDIKPGIQVIHYGGEKGQVEKVLGGTFWVRFDDGTEAQYLSGMAHCFKPDPGFMCAPEPDIERLAGLTFGDPEPDPPLMMRPTYQDMLRALGVGSPEPDPLTEHPAVLKHGTGVSSEELASFVEALASLGQSRVMTTGHQQYADFTPSQLQKFETLDLDQMAKEFLEEVADAQVYNAMSAIKVLAAIRKAREALDV